MLTDTHAHLHFDQFRDDLPEVIQRARETGVRRILTLGTEPESSKASLKIARDNPEVFAAVGIHPTEIFKTGESNGSRIKILAAEEKKVVAIGEIGLDLYWKEVPLQAQLPVLEKMLQIAHELNLPVVIHNREAQKEMQHFFRALGISSLRGVMHSFAGSAEDAQFYLSLGMYISFTGVITFKNFKELAVVKSIPPERLLLETDCPFLAPVPKRGKRNEPAFVKYTAEKLAEIFELPFEEICRITAQNANQLFGWG